MGVATTDPDDRVTAETKSAEEEAQDALCAGHPEDGVTWCGYCGYSAPPAPGGVCGHYEGGQAYCREFIGVRAYPVGDRCRRHAPAPTPVATSN